MKKKTAAAAAVLALMLALCGCMSVDEGYEAALKQSSVPSGISSNSDKEDDTQADAGDSGTDDATQTGDTTDVSVEWPEGIPAITNYKTMVEEKWLSDGSFSVQCLLTKDQYQSWQSQMKRAGFESSPATALGWTAEWTATEQTDGGYRLKLTVVKATEQTTTESGWPTAFIAFPEYNGDGEYSYTFASGSANEIVLTVTGETRTGFERYTAALISAGFVKDGAVYSMTKDNVTYTVDTAGAWIDTDTVSITLAVG